MWLGIIFFNDNNVKELLVVLCWLATSVPKEICPEQFGSKEDIRQVLQTRALRLSRWLAWHWRWKTCRWRVYSSARTSHQFGIKEKGWNREETFFLSSPDLATEKMLKNCVEPVVVARARFAIERYWKNKYTRATGFHSILDRSRQLPLVDLRAQADAISFADITTSLYFFRSFAWQTWNSCWTSHKVAVRGPGGATFEAMPPSVSRPLSSKSI